MNQATKKTYTNDLIFQGFFYIPMMFLYFIGFMASEAFILGALVQFFVGASQVLSGAFHTVRYEDKAHKRYFIFAIGYLTFLFLGGAVFSNMYFRGSDVFLILFLFIIPVGIATWYYRLTWLAYKNADFSTGENHQNKAFQEDVLDDAML